MVLVRPAIIDEGLWKTLSEDQQAWVIEHERRHELCNKPLKPLTVPDHLLTDIVNEQLK